MDQDEPTATAEEVKKQPELEEMIEEKVEEMSFASSVPLVSATAATTTQDKPAIKLRIGLAANKK
eukprot:Pgem_evm1s17148